MPLCSVSRFLLLPDDEEADECSGGSSVAVAGRGNDRDADPCESNGSLGEVSGRSESRIFIVLAIKGR